MTGATYMEELEKLLLVPESPLGTQGEWSSVEAHLGVELPDDYKAFISKYGSGRAAGFLRVYNYLNDVPVVERHLAHHRELLRQLGQQRVSMASQVGRQLDPAVANAPYALFPQQGGLLPWGEAEDWWSLYWRCEGH